MLALTTAVLVLALGGLVVLGLVGISGLTSRTRSVDDAVVTLSAYQDVQRAIAAEAFAEAGYRRAPGATSRARVEASALDLASSVRAVRALRSPVDTGTINYLMVLNTRYQNEVSASLRTGTSAPPTSRDDRVAGPALDAMQALVDGAVARSQQLADAALDEQRGLLGRMRFVGPLTLLVAVAAVSLCWWVVVRQNRKVHGRAVESEHRSLHDALTGAGNRALLSRELARELAAPDAGLLMLDLDRFKDVNDTFGHAAGDEVLRVIAQRLQGVAGPQDVVSRMGGDEFALLVRPAARLEAVAAAVRRVVAEPVAYGNVLLATGASVGETVLRPGSDERAVLTDADDALYVVKRRHVPAPRRHVQL